jgi:hypothetical protein
MIELGTSKAAKFVDAFTHLSQDWDITIIPKSPTRPRGMIT